MIRRTKRLHVFLLAIGLLAAGLFLLMGPGTSKVSAAPDGSCGYTYSASQLGTEAKDTKLCTDYVAKFSQAATDAVAAKECYVYLNKFGLNSKTTITVDARDCGTDAAGTCTDQFIAQRDGINTSNKVACNTITAKFENAAKEAASSGNCYILTEKLLPNTNTNQLTLHTAECGNPENTAVGGEGFDNEGPGGNLDQVSEEAFGTCAEHEEDVTNACGLIDKYVNPLINVLSAAVGLIVVIMIIIGGIQYASAGGDSKKVADAKARITNALIALLTFIFLFAVLQWLVPGGLF
jgi:hypothetical protein